MTPETRKGASRLWKDLWALACSWEYAYPAPTAAACARQLKAILLPFKPRPQGRPPKSPTYPP